MAMLGLRICRDNYRWRWSKIEHMLAALYRYIPRGKTKNSHYYQIINVVNATGDVGLHGQEILCVIVGKVHQSLRQLKNGEQLTTYTKGIGPKWRLELNHISFDSLSCFDVSLPQTYDERRVLQPERLFKDLVMLVGAYGIHTSFDKKFSELVKDIPNANFIVDPPLSVDEAKIKRNQIYEHKLHGSGNPWSPNSWNFKKTKKKRRRCQPDIGWKASSSITDYLSGTINCKQWADLKKVWEVVSTSEFFKLYKMINRLDTPSREMYCVGKFTVEPPIHHQFGAIAEERKINAFIATIRVRYDLQSIKGYNHFEVARKNYLLSTFYSPEEFFFPGILRKKKDSKSIILKLEDSLQRSEDKKKEMRKDYESMMSEKNVSLKSHLSVSCSQKRLCPQSHPLDPIPVDKYDFKCRVCTKVLLIHHIMWHCSLCDWLSCDDCFHKQEPGFSRLVKRSVRGSAITLTNIRSGQNTHSKGLYVMSSRSVLERVEDLKAFQNALRKKDEEVQKLKDRVRDLEDLLRISEAGRRFTRGETELSESRSNSPSVAFNRVKKQSLLTLPNLLPHSLKFTSSSSSKKGSRKEQLSESCLDLEKKHFSTPHRRLSTSILVLPSISKDDIIMSICDKSIDESKVARTTSILM